MKETVHRIFYGRDALQYGDLRVPIGHGPFPVIMIIHGGCWRSAYSLSLMEPVAIDLTNRGYASWNIEYRRTEDPEGGWPGTFHDIANALKHLIDLERPYHLDLENILVVGHSAGGHLALWIGDQHLLSVDSEIFIPDLPRIKGIISLAGITDLATYMSPDGCGSNVINLIGGKPNALPKRYADASPMEMKLSGINRILVNGDNDDTVSLEHITPYYKRVLRESYNIDLISIAGAGHMEVIDPGSLAWPAIVEGVERSFRK